MNQALSLLIGLAISLIPAAETSSSALDSSPVSTVPAITQNMPAPKVTRNVREAREVWITAYSSTPEETDDTPFITASGSYVRDGIIATNLLPFGTEVKIPAFFGDKIFVVEDRMHRRKTNNVDIWMASKSEALKFGRQYATILVLE